MWYGYSFVGLELGSSFSPPLAEDLLVPAFFFPSFKEIHYFFRHCHHMARQQVCVTRRFDFSTAFTVDLLKHLWDQIRDFVLDEISNSELFSSAYIKYFQLAKLNFNSHFASLQAWISSPGQCLCRVWQKDFSGTCPRTGWNVKITCPTTKLTCPTSIKTKDIICFIILAVRPLKLVAPGMGQWDLSAPALWPWPWPLYLK